MSVLLFVPGSRGPSTHTGRDREIPGPTIRPIQITAAKETTCTFEPNFEKKMCKPFKCYLIKKVEELTELFRECPGKVDEISIQ